MADRLNKITEFLNTNNHDAAIRAHNEQPIATATLEPALQLQLARAFYFVAADYRQAIQILQRVQDSRLPEVRYEARMLLARACLLAGGPANDALTHLRELSGIENKYHQRCIDEIRRMVELASRPPANGGSPREEGEQFQRLRREEDDNSIIMEGMPQFLVARVWFEGWLRWVGLEGKHMDSQGQTRRHPGPITQFQLVDYPFRVLADPHPGKEYTNRFIFGCASDESYEILPKKCWEFLRSRYDGVEVKRFNISFVDRPYEIVTEVILKRIEIAHEDTRNYAYLQITRKETWAGVKAKLTRLWGETDGEIVQVDERGALLPVNEGDFLEEVDTAGKRFLLRRLARKPAQVEKCGNKGCGKTEKLSYCKCRAIKYCGLPCAKQDYKNHKKKCELEVSHSQQQSVVFKNFNLEEKEFGGRRGCVGLKNLGNTCYMNSGLQCLSNTRQMTEYFMRADFKNHINYTNPLGTKGYLSCTYAELVREMWTGNADAVSPFKLKKIIGNFATQFAGFGQQDSQEFISYLIDGLSEDLNLVKKKETFETGEEIKPDEEMSRESEVNYAKRINSYIRSLMVGQYKSTVICSTCNKVSVCFDPFLLISMPVPPTEAYLFFVPAEISKCAIRLAIPLSFSTTTLDKVGKEITLRYNKMVEREKRDSDSKKERVVPERLLYLLIDEANYRLTRFLDPSQLLSAVQGPNHLIFCLQIPEADPVLVQYRKDAPEGALISFPRFLRLPRQLSASQRNEIIMQSLKRGIDERRSFSPSPSDIFACGSVAEGKPFNKMTVVCKRELKLLTYTDPEKAGMGWQFEDRQSKPVSLEDCLRNFSQEEVLTGDNLWYCNRCKEHKEATRRMQAYKSNKILVIAFKRFNRMRKINTRINFPLEGFNMGNYLLSNKGKGPILYDLYGVVNHYGSLGAGHYTAYCQNFLDKKWYEFNDSRVSGIRKDEVVSDNSYVLFYRRRD